VLAGWKLKTVCNLTSEVGSLRLLNTCQYNYAYKYAQQPHIAKGLLLREPSEPYPEQPDPPIITYHQAFHFIFSFEGGYSKAAFFEIVSVYWKQTPRVSVSFYTLFTY
jgi:hypothetical protein